ncbi:MAG: hypothetical protein ABFS45_13025, partial [Pseudomonadota bacterium]
MPSRWNLTLRIAASAALLTLITTLILGGASYQAMRIQMMEKLSDALSESVYDVAQHQNSRLQSLRNQLSSLASNTLIGNALVDDIGRDIYLQSFLEDFHQINGIP